MWFISPTRPPANMCGLIEIYNLGDGDSQPSAPDAGCSIHGRSQYIFPRTRAIALDAITMDAGRASRAVSKTKSSALKALSLSKAEAEVLVGG